MQFVSIEWFAWMAGTVALFWAVPAAWRHYALAGVTLAFVLIYSPISAAYLAAFTLMTYFLSRGTHPSGYRISALVAVIVAVLGVYKVMISADEGNMLESVVMPLGLSYYSFRCIHYLIERYKGGLPRHDFRDLVFYLLFLPTIVVGPIHRFPAFHKDLRRHRWDGRMLSEGLERILYGYVKIAVIGNYLVSGQLAAYIGGLDPSQQVLIYYLEIVRTGLNLYFQFSGFSDVAIGFSRLLGFRVMENFNWPYLQKNISDFWRCWHISLTGFVREYVYTSAISISRSPAVGALASMFVIGMWHEVSLRYAVWVVYHSIGIIIWQQFQKLKPSLPAIAQPWLRRLLDAASIVLTVHFVWVGFVIVRQKELADAWRVISTVLLFWT